MANSKEFLLAADIVKKLKNTPNDNYLLKLYGLYKQATSGDNNNSAPGFLDFKGKSKHQAWLNCKGKSTYEELEIYLKHIKVADVEAILNEYRSIS